MSERAGYKSKLPTVCTDIYSADMEQPERNRESHVENYQIT